MQTSFLRFALAFVVLNIFCSLQGVESSELEKFLSKQKDQVGKLVKRMKKLMKQTSVTETTMNSIIEKLTSIKEDFDEKREELSDDEVMAKKMKKFTNDVGAVLDLVEDIDVETLDTNNNVKNALTDPKSRLDKIKKELGNLIYNMRK